MSPNPIINRRVVLSDLVGFLPSDLSNLYWWIRADVGVTAPGNDVSSVQDFGSAGKNMVQAVGLDQPTLVTNQINGKPVIRFDGTDHFMTAGVANDWQFLNNGCDYTLFYVWRTTDANPDDFYMLCSTGTISSGVIGFDLVYDDRSGVPRSNQLAHLIHKGSLGNSVIVNRTSDEAIVTQTADITRVTYEQGAAGDDSNLYVGGVLMGSSDELNAPVVADPVGALHIGASTIDTIHLKGDVAEIAIYNRLLSGSEMIQVEDYLSTKWAL
jgi:hypothetical protein